MLLYARWMLTITFSNSNSCVTALHSENGLRSLDFLSEPSPGDIIMLRTDRQLAVPLNTVGVLWVI